MEMPSTQEKAKLRDPKICKIFFSSPFGGMEEEREELTRQYFPQIQHTCNAKGIQFVAVDMRWGITSQAAENAQVINICLREIDRSDIFVGFFGQRYGWHGADDKSLQDNFDNAVSQYPWLDTVRDRSVTELEFLHGHLNNPGALPACICFRDKVYDDMRQEIGLSKGDKKEVFKYSTESDHATKMMDDLKKRVKATGDKCLGVDMAYNHPHKGAKFMFETIWPYLTKVLLANVSKISMTKREQKLEEHKAFRERHLSVYKGGQQYLEFLHEKLQQGQGDSILITGPAGSGKSALLGNWTELIEKSNPEAKLVYHFVGCAPGTTGAYEILSRLLWEVKHTLGKEEETTETENKENSGNDIQMQQSLLLAAIEEVLKKTQQKLVIVLDGLDRALKAGKTSKHLYWLPDTWPQDVLFVTSSVDTDTDTFDLLVSQRGYKVLTIQPLQEEAKQKICVGILKKSGKELSTEQLSRVVAADQTNSPLYLRLVLAELSMFGYFRLLDKKIDSLIYCEDVGELLQKIFSRLEEDYNGKDEHTTLVQEVLCAIELSHHGLLENELMEILGVESQVWLPLFFAMEGLLVSHSGLLRFGFLEISQAVQAKYLRDEQKKMHMLKKLIGYFDEQLQRIPVWADLMTDLSKRPVQELPWLQQAAGDMEGLSAALLNIFTLHRMQNEYRYEFLEMWQSTGKKMSDVCDLYLSEFDLAVTDLYLHNQDMTFNQVTPPGLQLQPLLNDLKELLEIADCDEGALKILQRNVAILTHVKGAMEADEYFQAMLTARYFLACSLVNCHQYQEGEELHRQLMDECRIYLEQNPDHNKCRHILGLICNGIGVAYTKQRQHTEAAALFEESLEHHSQLGNKEQIASSYGNLGMSLMECGKLDKALQYLEESLKMTEEVYFGHLPLEVGNLLTNIGVCYRRLNNLDQAEEMYKRSLQVKANAVGWDHDVVALAYMNLCALHMHNSDYAAALQFSSKALAIYEHNDSTLDKPEYRQTMENHIVNLVCLQRYEEALKMYHPLFHKLRELGMDNCIASIHREMAKYLISIGDTDTARDVTLALINSKERHINNYIIMDHLRLQLPEDQRSNLPHDSTLEYGLTVWPGNPDLTRRFIEFHALPSGDIDIILQVQKVCADNNREWGAFTYNACADWCVDGENMEAAVQVLEAGLVDYPDALDLKVRLMDHYRKLKQGTRAYPHLQAIVEGRNDDPACMIVAGDIARQSGDYQLALECFDRVCTLDNPQLAQMAEENAKLVREALADAENEETAESSQNEVENREMDVCHKNPENGERNN